MLIHKNLLKMKLNKKKMARLTNEQAQSINGGAGSTEHNFTCSWCTSDSESFECKTVNTMSDPDCHTTKPAQIF